MNTTWFPISNELVKDIPKITPKGFTILSYLIIESCHHNYIRTSISDIVEHTSIKDHRTIRKYLSVLQSLNYISSTLDIDYNTINRSHLFQIDLLYKSFALNTGYEMMPTELYINYINNIGVNSWTLLCLLAVYHNEIIGYAFPSYDLLKFNLRINYDSIHQAIETLKQYNLISVPNQQQTFELNNGIYKFTNNHYCVNYFKDKDWITFRESLGERMRTQ